MNAPRVSHPREPGLFARAPNLERYRVAAGGVTLVDLQPGDGLHVIDVEGRQTCTLLALDAGGRSALASWGLNASTACRVPGRIGQALQRRGIDAQALPLAASLWDADSPPGHSRQFVAEDALLVIVAAPAEATAVDRQYRPSELRLIVTRTNPSTLLVPALPEPLGDVLDEFTLRAGTAHSYTVAKGQYIQVLDVAGRQCSDFVALDRRALDRGVELDLDQTVTRTLNGSAYPAPGLFSKFFDRHMQPMLEVVQDTVGRHDSFALACAARYYETHGYFGHDNCSDNLSRVLAPQGVQARNGWPAINFFFNTGIDAHQQMTLDEPWSRPGDYVLLRAMNDLLCGSTSCPDDIDPANGWNPTDIHVRIYSEKERFSIAMSTRTTADADPILTRESAFHSRTRALTGSFTDYRNWWLPLRYDGYGVTEEYLGCRERVAVMDLTALRKFEIIGPDAEALLQYCLTRDVRRLAVGQVVYSAMCHAHGGMLDDGTLLRLGPDNFRWICGEDYAGVWLREQAQKLGMKVWVKSASEQIHNLAVQGPLSRELLKQMVWTPPTQPSVETLGWFRFLVGRLDGFDGCPLMISRTGYTGELGFEVWCQPEDAVQVWDRIWQLGQPLGLVPLGLEALDLLRIEAGLIFAGYEFSDQTDPFEAGIGFSVPLKSKTDDFIGRDALLRRSAHPSHKLVGLHLSGNEVAHHGDPVYQGRAQVGVITSACRSPLLASNIALCRVDVSCAEPGTELEIGKVDGLQKRISATVSAAIFYDPDKSRVRS
ncbi:aminomethyltransferase family protein [Pseudomonas sp. MAFF 311096]|uniref:Aminomethyltransferase family protein n=1 Tax=Pseudomonas petroselini TaxID=2899822 RepID=A0ABS8QSR6_9PSED|nr:aminomethyltransferase family protein [Pseudomonas petroselini]MCD7038571.1 aminomethyltransferase family protein [Pseudomonas petroselini]MCD7044252.1 aminomethyltransferase family protein [Pseudomonas petroselini]MCD7071164.1 aminomethyltransferase family protein [Pseudomonas petroselini]